VVRYLRRDPCQTKAHRFGLVSLSLPNGCFGGVSGSAHDEPPLLQQLNHRHAEGLRKALKHAHRRIMSPASNRLTCSRVTFAFLARASWLRPLSPQSFFSRIPSCRGVGVMVISLSLEVESDHRPPATRSAASRVARAAGKLGGCIRRATIAAPRAQSVSLPPGRWCTDFRPRARRALR
jgi:hypothetical protein